MKKHRFFKLMIFFTLGIFFAGCSLSTSRQEQSGDKKEDTAYNVILPGTYDSADTAVLLKKNKEEKTLSFYNIATGKQYTLNYDGTSAFYDKHDTAMALDQVKEGSIVDVTFLKSRKKLNTLQTSKEAWSNTQVSRFQINENRKDITIGSDVYKYSDDLVIMADARQLELMDVNTVDKLTVSGIGTSVYSMQIEEGHGYLRLTGDEYFIGGWIEVGQALIQEITEGMLLTVPEGTYEVAVSHNGSNGTRRITINRNEETTLDISDLKGEGIKTGTVLFTVKPSNAQVFVDGNEVDISGPIELEYGIHQLMAKADGYKTSTSYLKVAEESAGISIVLDEIDEETITDTSDDTEEEEETGANTGQDDDTVSDSDSNDKKEQDKDTVSSSDTPTTTDYYKVYIDSPTGAEVYLNGNYIGISPVSFRKTEGTHVVTLRKTGYVTRSYTLNIDNAERDVSYSFVEMEKAED